MLQSLSQQMFKKSLVGTSTVAAARGGIAGFLRKRRYSSTRPIESYVPMVLESTPRGERAYDIYSRLLRVRRRFVHDL